METEFEVKFYPVDKETIRKKLKSLGAQLVVAERKMRRVIFDKKVNPQIKGHYLRVRDEVNKIILSLKVHAEEGGKISDQKEVAVEVSDFEKTVEIIELAGLKQSNYQESLRETWEYQGVEITIDAWPKLQPIVEIEAESEKKVKEIAKKLGFDWNKRIFTSTLEIFAKAYNLSENEAWEKLNYITFEDDSFNN